uniref:Uncharacterized protein n=1 Tax=Anguilla anguilla TaxID=7936 RepID=A0A0E9Q0K4_ANGAN
MKLLVPRGTFSPQYAVSGISEN